MLRTALSGTNKMLCFRPLQDSGDALSTRQAKLCLLSFPMEREYALASCMGVVAAFRRLKPLSNFHKIWYERYSISADTIIFLLKFPRSILITA